MLQFIDSARFMVSSLSNLVNNLSEEIHEIKSKWVHDGKKFETCGITYEICDCFLEYTNFKDDLIEHKCLCCDKNYQEKFDKKLKERFLNTWKFSNHDNSQFILLLQKGNGKNWKKFNETSLPEKEDFYSHLHMEDIIIEDYTHAKNVCKDFEIKNLREYHLQYCQNFQNICLKIYQLDHANFFQLLDQHGKQLLKR